MNTQQQPNSTSVPIPVNVGNFIRAETDMYFGKTVEDSAPD